MKVLFVIHGLPVGGAETVTVNNLLKLREQGVDVVLVTHDDRPSFLRDRVIREGLPFYSILPYCGNGFFGKLKRYVLNKIVGKEKKWRRILAKERPDVVHYNGYGDLIRIFPFPPEKSVLTIHSDVERAIGGCDGTVLSYHRDLAKAGLTFFALSRKAESDVKRFFDTERVAYIPNGINLGRIKADVYPKSWLTERFGVPADAFVLGHIGRFHAVKNHEKVLSVFDALCVQKPGSYLVLVGGDVDGRLEKIREEASDRGLLDRVLFLGIRDDADLIAGCFDAFVMPSFSEAFSLTVLEAQAAGVRCVGSDRIPDEVFCTPQAFRLSLDETDETWARTLLSKETSGRENRLEEFEIGHVIRTMITQYEKLI